MWYLDELNLPFSLSVLVMPNLQVYVSCNPTKSLPADALLLCSAVSNSTSGLPFRPVKVRHDL